MELVSALLLQCSVGAGAAATIAAAAAAAAAVVPDEGDSSAQVMRRKDLRSHLGAPKVYTETFSLSCWSQRFRMSTAASVASAPPRLWPAPQHS